MGTRSLVPDHIWKITMHYHDLIYIKSYWESLGQHPPTWVKTELERVDRVMAEAMAEETNQGGSLWEQPKGTDG